MSDIAKFHEARIGQFHSIRSTRFLARCPQNKLKISSTAGMLTTVLVYFILVSLYDVSFRSVRRNGAI